ncbi:FERM domain-containing protein 6 [Aplochiton taeniatus]
MSVSAKPERTVCVLLPNKEQLDITVGAKSTGQDVFNRVLELLGIKELHFFGFTVVKDNEHIYLDMEEKLIKYFPKEWKQDSGKGFQKRSLPLLLCLKVQYYVENGRLICERKARRLYYSDLRERVLRSECRQQEEVYFQLAGYALQADLADHPPPADDHGGTTPYFQPKEYFPPWIVAKRGVDYLHCHGPKVHRELWGMPARDAILHFIRESCRLEDVPVTFYRLQKDKKEERGTALLGLTLRGMQVYQEVNNIRQLLYDFPWFNVGRLTFLGKKFEIQPDGLPSARKLVYYTGSPFRSRHLLLHLSSSHRLYMSLQPALKHLRQLEESEEKKRYRESYISDDLDTDPPGSEGSPRLSRHSTSSLGMEANTRQHSVSPEMASMEEEGTQRADKCFSSVASHGSSNTSGIDTGSKARTDEEEWQEEEAQVSVECPKEVSVDDPEEILQLAELLEGVSVDCPDLNSDTCSSGDVDCSIDLVKLRSKDTLGQVLKSRIQLGVDRHSQSLDDVRLLPPPAPLGTTLLPDSSHSYTFGLPDPQLNTKSPGGHSYYLPLHYPSKPSFYGRRSTNCLSLDLLGDEQLLEFIL